MPKVPTYDSPSVQSRGIPNASIRTGGVSADAFGAGLGRAMESGGQALMKVGQAIDQANEKKAVADGMDASDTLNQEWNAKQQEFSQLKGKDAANVQKDMGAWYDKRAAEIGAGLEDERARRLFDRNAKRLRMSADDWAFGYQEKQGDVYFLATMESNIKSAQQSAIFNPTNENIAQQVDVAHGIYKDIAHRKGFDSNWVNQNTETMRQGLYGDILKNAMQQDAVGSVSSFIEEHGDSIDPGLRGQAEKWVHNKYIDESSGAYADTLIASGASLDDALEGAKKKYSGDDLEKVENKILRNYGRENQIKNARTKEINDQFEEIAYKAGVENLTDDQLDDLAKTDSGAALRWKTLRNKTIEVKAKGGEYADDSDIEIKNSLNRAIIEGDIKDEQAIRKYKGALSKPDYNEAVKLMENQQTLKDSDAESAFKVVTGDKYDKNEKTFEKYVAFQNWAAGQIKASGRTQDINALAAKWFLKGEVQSGKLFAIDHDKTYGEALQAGEVDRFIPDKELEETPVTSDYLKRQKVEAGRAAQIEAAKKWLETADPNDPKTIAVRKKLGM